MSEGAVVDTTSGVAPGAAAPVGEDPLALDRQVCFALAVASRSVIALYRPVLEPLGLTHPQYLVMLALWQHEPLAVKELGALLQLDSGTLSPLLKRLAAAGLVTKERHRDDERSVLVTLTPAGRALRARAEAVPLEVVRRLGLGVDELTALHRALSGVIAAAAAG
jgi:DNA-binding MarR family transcriptional regulator